MMRASTAGQRAGFTLTEVIVAMALLAILAASLVAVLPQLSRGTTAAAEDTALSTIVYDVLERLVSDWSNNAGWDAPGRIRVGENGDFVDLADHVDAVSDGACGVTIQSLESDAVRVVIIACSGGPGPDIEMRAAYGSPAADGDGGD